MNGSDSCSQLSLPPAAAHALFAPYRALMARVDSAAGLGWAADMFRTRASGLDWTSQDGTPRNFTVLLCDSPQWCTL